jgi:hypothetical protein
MNSKLATNIIRFIILVFIQSLILNRINLGGYMNPYLYILFILLLPFETPKWLLLVSSFMIGLFIDSFSNSYGIHAAASTFMAFSRPAILRMITSKKEYEPGIRPGIKDLGFNWFFTYSSMMILSHHFILFFLETFRFSEFFITIWRVILNSTLTLAIIMLSQYLIYNIKQKD